MYKRFGLTLMVTQACNLNCRYCYIVHKNTEISQETAEHAVLCAVRSIEPGGILNLGFFGGEPFLAWRRIEEVINFAKNKATKHNISSNFFITTNGTILNEDIWSIIHEPNLRISISIDGKSETHDQNRFFPDGGGSYEAVKQTIESLIDRNVEFGIVKVVRPETVKTIDDDIRHLRNIGCHNIELSLDVWSSWNSDAMTQLQNSISRCAQLWIEGLPDYTLNWFDDKAVMLSDSPVRTISCGFGKGDIAVTPDGHLYPCERLIADDSPNNPMRMADNVLDRKDFLFGACTDLRTAEQCLSCGIKAACNTTCGCCNFIRTGKPGLPDKLLCLFNQWCLDETRNVLENRIVP